MTSSALIAIIQFALAQGADLVGRVKDVADILHPNHALTNDEINALELEAQADDDRRIARRTPPADGSGL